MKPNRFHKNETPGDGGGGEQPRLKRIHDVLKQLNTHNHLQAHLNSDSQILSSRLLEADRTRT